MKKIDIEKELDLNGVVDIISLDMKDNFTYRKEEGGIRCIGPFYIHGRYSTLNEVKSFHDVFEFDVFASNEKLDGEPFTIQYVGYDYSVLDKVKLFIRFDVYGIYDPEENENYYSEVEMFDLRDTKEEINEKVLAEEENLQEVTKVDEIEDEQEIKEVRESEEVDLNMMEELFDDKDNVITSYSFVVVKEEDSYESIANRYGVDANALKEVNHHKELQVKQLIVLPYGRISKEEEEKA